MLFSQIYTLNNRIYELRLNLNKFYYYSLPAISALHGIIFIEQ